MDAAIYIYNVYDFLYYASLLAWGWTPLLPCKWKSTCLDWLTPPPPFLSICKCMDITRRNPNFGLNKKRKRAAPPRKRNPALGLKKNTMENAPLGLKKPTLTPSLP
jgi:hypothetical protein